MDAQILGRLARALAGENVPGVIMERRGQRGHGGITGLPWVGSGAGLTGAEALGYEHTDGTTKKWFMVGASDVDGSDPVK